MAVIVYYNKTYLPGIKVNGKKEYVQHIIWYYMYYMVLLSNPNVTQLNSKATLLRLDTVATWNTPTHHPTPTFSATSRRARELKFGTDTHYANLIKITVDQRQIL